MGSVYPRRNKLWIRFKGPDGKWTQSTTDFHVGDEKKARKLLERVQEKIKAGAALGEKELGPTTVARYAARWNEDRKKLGIIDWENDARWLRIHALPKIGAMPIAEVRARHLIELFTALRSAGKLAPKSIYNVYSVLKAMFRDAQLADLIDTSPCVLTRYQLGENEDADPEWRATAIYSRDELTAMISDPRIPPDRQMLYALEGIGALRHGEAAGLRWRHYDPTQVPLGRLIIATSYARGRTKTGRTRYMPVHPTLAAMLDAWKAEGWGAMMGRAPSPDDLVVPRPPEHTDRRRSGRGNTMRDKNYSGKRLRDDDLPALGFRHRRGHDLRRTMISIARTDGARKDLLELCTHNPRKNGSTIDIYTEFPWEALCAEVAKLKITRPVAEVATAEPAATPELEAGNAERAGEPLRSDPPFATRLATREAIPESFQSDERWRRRESNPGPQALGEDIYAT